MVVFAARPEPILAGSHMLPVGRFSAMPHRRVPNAVVQLEYSSRVSPRAAWAAPVRKMRMKRKKIRQ